MLKDNLFKTIQIMKKGPNSDLIPFNFRGELNVKAWKNGELFYHDGGDNTITIWAKHSMMHLLTGDVFSHLGLLGKNTLEVGETDHDDTVSFEKNTDGCLISGEQYWWDNAIWGGQWSLSSDSFAGESAVFPFFPTKMLFGTGKEYVSWAHVLASASVEEQTVLAEKWADAATFNNLISDENNYYSGTILYNAQYQKYGSGSIQKCRTVNDYLSEKIDGSPEPNEYGVVGAIKNGTLDFKDATKLQDAPNNDVLKVEYQGIGKPAFIYLKRNVKWNDNSSDVFLSNDGAGYENKITFTVTMPDQTAASNALGWYYPYNGYTLKEVGLFSDSLTSLGGNDDGNYPYQNMMSGSMLAKRYIAPLNKTKEVAVSAQWTLYL